jgi:SMP-30/Gluconolactonase/LRE-like region
MKPFLSTLFLSAAAAQAATIFMGTYHDTVIAFDEAKGQVVSTIPLTGLPGALRLSDDKKTLFVTTGDHSGIAVIDVATRKVTNHFELNTPTTRIRFNAGGVPDPQGKLIYTITTEMKKLADHYEIGKPKYTVIDLAQQKIVKTVDIAKEDEAAISQGRGRAGFEISPDGKYLYHFGEKVLILSTDDFKVVDHLDLAKPDLPGMEAIGFNGQLDSISEPGMHVSVFNSSDPIVHNRVFGIGRFDLNSRQMTFDPIGPAPAAMTGLQVAPDKSHAYTVVTNGTLGNKRCEFWQFDLKSDRIVNTKEFACRSRFSFGMSGDGKKLYIYGAGFEIESYNAATLQYERTYDLNNDVTGGGLIVVP